MPTESGTNVNHPHRVIVRQTDQTGTADPPPPEPSRPKKPRHRSPLALLLTFAGIAVVWLAVMWGVFEVMSIHSGQTVIPAN
jgi:hypothetical protein